MSSSMAGSGQGTIAQHCSRYGYIELGIEVARYSLWRYALMRRSDPGCAMLALPLQQDPGDAPVHVRNSLRLGGC